VLSACCTDKRFAQRLKVYFLTYVEFRRDCPLRLNLHKVSTLALFKSITDHKQYLPRDQPYKDLVNLIQFLLRQFFKTVEDDPFIIVHVRAYHPVFMLVPRH